MRDYFFLELNNLIEKTHFYTGLLNEEEDTRAQCSDDSARYSGTTQKWTVRQYTSSLGQP